MPCSFAGPAIDFENVFESWFDGGVRLHDLFINIGDLKEVYRLVEKCVGGFFVGGVESASHGSSGGGGVVCELEAAECFEVGFFEREVWCFDGVPGFELVGGSFGVEEGVLYGEAHIGPA